MNEKEDEKALLDAVQQYKTQLETVSQNAADELRTEIKIDKNLFDSSYKSILKTRNELMSDYYKQEYLLHDIGEELRDIREAIDKT